MHTVEYGFGSQVYRDNILVQQIELNGSTSKPSNSKCGRISVSARVSLDTRDAASQDDVQLTVDYKRLYDALTSAVADVSATTFEKLGTTLAQSAFTTFPILSEIQIEVRSAETSYNLGYLGRYLASSSLEGQRELFIEDFTTRCRIGVYDWERKVLQDITLNIYVDVLPEYLQTPSHYRLTERVSRVCLVAPSSTTLQPKQVLSSRLSNSQPFLPWKL
jgi:dihydroneopterin aldolase